MSKSRYANVTHEDFVERQRAVARAYDGSYEHRGVEVKIFEHTCSNCARKKHCMKNRIKIVNGVASVGGEQHTCGKWLEVQNNFYNPKQVSVLLKSFTKQR